MIPIEMIPIEMIPIEMIPVKMTDPATLKAKPRIQIKNLKSKI
jgi:hypothetical protein